MTTLETLNRWLADASENEHLEFKEAKQQYDTTKLLRYCVALANEGGGHLVLGVSDKRPRQVVGTQAFQNRGEITARILEALRMRVDVQELQHPDGRVLVFAVPPRPAGTPLHHEGAYLMRAGEELVCEEKGSGIDKVVHLAEVFQLPAPDFRTSETRTTAVLFAHQDFAAMSKPDRIRACYQHCALKYVSNERMSNQSLRERFRLPESKAATASQVIGATKEAGLIKTDESDTTSTRYARYLPFWA